MAVKTSNRSQQASRNSQSNASGETVLEQLPQAQDMIEYARDYCRANPETAALWCFGIGFVLGWKLKPW